MKGRKGDKTEPRIRFGFAPLLPFILLRSPASSHPRTAHRLADVGVDATADQVFVLVE